MTEEAVRWPTYAELRTWPAGRELEFQMAQRGADIGIDQQRRTIPRWSTNEREAWELLRGWFHQCGPVVLRVWWDHSVREYVCAVSAVRLVEWECEGRAKTLALAICRMILHVNDGSHHDD